MLRQLILENFGRFRGERFEFAQFTVFCGGNESGKTTLFDAIRIHTFSPERRSRENRRVYERYGGDAVVQADWSGDQPVMNDGTFMNLFAVRGGEMAPDFSQDWVAELKKRLFTGGVDLQALQGELENRASDKGTLRHMREFKELEDEYRKRESQLAEKQALRDRVLGDLESLAGEAEPLEKIKSELAGCHERLTASEAEARQQERIASRATVEEQLTLLAELRDVEAWLAAHAQFAADESGALTTLEAARETEREALHAATATRNAARTGIGRARENQHQRETTLEQGAPLHTALGEIRAQIAAQRRQAAHRGLSLAGLLLPGVLALLGGLLLLGAWLAHTPAAAGSAAASGSAGLLVPGAVILGLILLVGAGLVPALRIGLHRRSAIGGESLLVAEAREQWRVVAAQHADGVPAWQPLLSASSLAGLETGLREAGRELERWGLQMEEAAQAVRDADVALDRAEGALDTAERRAADAQAALESWLRSREASNRDAYRDTLAAYEAKAERREQITTRVQQWLREGGYSNVEALRSVSEVRLKDLDAGGVPRDAVSSETRAATRRGLESLREQIADLTRRREEETLRLNSSQQYHRGQLGALPEEIASLSQQLRELEGRLGQSTLDREAAALAGEMVDAIAGEESTVLAELAGSVSRAYREMTGAGDAAGTAVEIAALDAPALQARDLEGTLRPLVHLSSGARQLLYLALRLEMARRSTPEGFALLCLDEPFAHLDPGRLASAMKFLRRFVEDTGWQLVLFTADPEQAQLAARTFDDCRVHTLP